MRFDGLAVLGDSGALLAQSTLQFDDRRPDALLAFPHPLLHCQAVDLALDDEQRIDAHDRLDCDPRLVEARQIEEPAPRMRPANGQ